MFDLDAVKNHVIEKITTTYGDDLIAIYGIGSAFHTIAFRNPDIDVIVILKSIEKCPRKDFTTALFEKEEFDEHTIFYGYSNYEDMFSKENYEKHSLANWEWAMRDLKYGSTLIYGKRIVDELPVPDYDYQAIFLRIAYWIDRTIRYGNEDQIALSKAIFKFGFFVTAIHHPDENRFDIDAVYELLLAMEDEGTISPDISVFYSNACKFREEDVNFVDFKKQRIDFTKLFIKETIDNVDGASIDSLKHILSIGFGDKGFQNVISIIDRYCS